MSIFFASQPLFTMSWTGEVYRDGRWSHYPRPRGGLGQCGNVPGSAGGQGYVPSLHLPGETGQDPAGQVPGKGKALLPAVIVIGIDPLLYIAARYQVPWGMSEFDFTGGLMGEPVEVIQGKYTDLPIPARAEIVLEGEVLAEERLPEGPFGEWNGYYAGGKRKSLCSRSNG